MKRRIGETQSGRAAAAPVPAPGSVSGGRLRSVIARELHSFRLERTLNATLRASQDYRSQLEVVLQRSNDAIAQAQEGILVDANASWLELFGFVEAKDAQLTRFELIIKGTNGM